RPHEHNCPSRRASDRVYHRARTSLRRERKGWPNVFRGRSTEQLPNAPPDRWPWRSPGQADDRYEHPADKCGTEPRPREFHVRSGQIAKRLRAGPLRAWWFGTRDISLKDSQSACLLDWAIGYLRRAVEENIDILRCPAAFAMKSPREAYMANEIKQ